ncbi:MULTISPECIES: DUF72 domain-containing protein [Pseudomonas]|uniref:DUF72 domain-containing protein n=1 Tax=Pseudomonas juntendi TaxID=2666183 RepID=A0A7W2R2B0_9PSED|nr:MULTISPECIES: DUF72 domain-containing protein [Pseudomonas]NOY03397.1 DUF72 domain-containing protein [Gammaproteobacteria bacterium]MBA6135039.1 DUF72 domain-containing protein [Pseudomonas juntendi]MBA6150715.1 DUF72 domain-containing protein [Pseudomonas juntendi]MCK2113508.1 DUF72 domain-containing protein [Pseudomonas juntendi]MCK2117634.1 DUF72 domain-containing protein [Pseudomonas juntendi]
MIHVGCAGWSLPRQYAAAFLQPGSHLQRYAARLGAVEINSSFYRPHLPATYARWACAVPADFRFAVKLPKHITHELQLECFEAALDAFLGQCQHLGDRLGCLLVQLPPSLAHDDGRDRRFFERLRQRHAGPVAVEPRHASWQAAQSMLVDLHIAQVAASPSRFGTDAQPAGWPGLVYWRLHGEPRIYRSEYSQQYLLQLAERLRRSHAAGAATWCVFDNTASGAALGNALVLEGCLS